MKFDIKPYESVGPLKWGMTSQDVQSLLGPAERVRKAYLGGMIEYRSQFSINCIYNVTGLLEEVTFYERRDAFFYRDLDLIASPARAVIEELYIMDRTAVSNIHGYIVYLNLGIELMNYQSTDKKDRAAGAFARGVWDDQLATMKPFQPKRRPQKS